jgi:hypothetical protein
MIQIQRREQFTKAAVRAQKEHMHVRRYEQNVYEVTNRAKGHSYLVRFTRLGANVFGTCTCEAGTPSTNRTPVVCKHLFAAVIFHRAVVAMRRAASH